MRNAVFLTLLVLAATPALAGPREDTAAGIARCASYADDRTYLNCVYGAAQPLRAQLKLPPATADQIRLVPPGAVAAQPTMPSVLPRTAAPSRIAIDNEFAGGMRERLDTFSFTRQGLFNIRLENGEMYKQEAGDAPRAKWLGRGSDYVVYVVKDGTGGAAMKVTGDPNVYRMRKIN